MALTDLKKNLTRKVTRPEKGRVEITYANEVGDIVAREELDEKTFLENYPQGEK